MAHNDSDRRRFLLATAVTLFAFPALWWANKQADTGAPNVATVGIEVDDGAADLTAGAVGTVGTGTVDTVPTTFAPTTAAVVTASTPTADELAPVFLEGPSAGTSGVAAEIAVPAPSPVAKITTRATYRSTVSPIDTCLVADIATGTRISVMNLDNGHTVSCIATRVYASANTGIVMHTDTFAQIADLTDAPIPVEITP